MKPRELYDANTYRSNRMIGRKFYKRLAGIRGLRVLEIGCGTGDLCAALTKDNEVHGIDFSSKSLETAKRRGIITKKHDIENGLPYDSNYFDTVICSELVEHLFDPEKVLAEANRVLRKGGVLLLSTPNFYSITNRLKIISGRHKGIELPDYTARQHIRFYSHASIADMLRRNNFSVIYNSGIGFHPISSETLLNLFEKRFKTLCDGIFLEAIKK